MWLQIFSQKQVLGQMKIIDYKSGNAFENEN